MKKTLLLLMGLLVADFTAQAQWVGQPIGFLDPESTLAKVTGCRTMVRNGEFRVPAIPGK